MYLVTFKPFFLLILLFTLAGCTVPAPTEDNTTMIEGKLAAVSTCCDGGDMQFSLDGYASSFYLNRAIEAGFDLDTFESEVSIGDTVYIRAFDQYLPNHPHEPARTGNIPSAHIATADKVYYSTMRNSP